MTLTDIMKDGFEYSIKKNNEWWKDWVVPSTAVIFTLSTEKNENKSELTLLFDNLLRGATSAALVQVPVEIHMFP